MAKKGKGGAPIVMKSTESGHQYSTIRSDRDRQAKRNRLELKKYDPFLKKHVMYREEKNK